MTISESRIGANLLRAQQSVHGEFADAVVKGLSARHKAIPCKFLYDAAGSALFEKICAQPEYYLTRTEIAILKAHARDIASIVGPEACVVELGSGASRKTRILLDALYRPRCYAPVDVSRAHLSAAAAAIAADYPSLLVTPICADYAEAFALPRAPGGAVAFFPGSTIGNLDRDGAVALLQNWRRRLGEHGVMIVGIDLKKDAALLEAAYNDSAGVTRAFIGNALVRANRELGADFDLNAFAYEAHYISRLGRVEMGWRSRAAQTVRACGRQFLFGAGEFLHVENSYKYSLGELRELTERSGFAGLARYTDPDHYFALEVWRA